MFQWGDWSSQPDIYILLGYPLTKTLSPQLHHAAFQNLQVQAVYLPLSTPYEQLPQVMHVMRGLKWRGANVTIPYKEKIINYLDEIDPLAEQIGAVNTIVNVNGLLKGYNTDTVGFLNSLPLSLHSIKKVICLGAGGAARAVCFTLLREGLTDLTIINRTEHRAQTLRSDLQHVYPATHIAVLSLEKTLPETMPSGDLVINTTPVDNLFSASYYEQIFAHCLCAYDLRYQHDPNLFLAKAAHCGVSAGIDGRSMLVWQAAEAFRLWTGVLPIEIMKQVMGC